MLEVPQGSDGEVGEGREVRGVPVEASQLWRSVLASVLSVTKTNNGTTNGVVHDVDPLATRGQLARDLKRARGRIISLVAIVDTQAQTIKDLRAEVARLKRLAHTLL